MATINRKSVVQEFFAWWGIYIIIFIALLLILSATGVTHTPLSLDFLSRDFLLSVDYAALGALMAVSHYYLLYTPYAKGKKYAAYFLLLICLIAVFMLLDALLVWVQTWGSMSFNRPLDHMLAIHFKHVVMVYVPATIVHTVSHIYQDKKKAGKNS